jgi:hypothetical protein
MGASRLERVEPHGGSPGWQSSSTAHWIFGAQVGLAEEHLRGDITGLPNRHQAVQRDRLLHRKPLSQTGPMWMPLRPPACQNQPGFGVAVLNCLQEVKIRPIWTALSSLK